MSEWGPWIEHTPGYWPRGLSGAHIVQAVLEDGWKLSPMHVSEIDWDCPGDDVIRYRIRKPRALQQLKDMVESLPEKEPAMAPPEAESAE